MSDYITDFGRYHRTVSVPVGCINHDCQTCNQTATKLRRLQALNEELLALAHQYANDMRYPPKADSRQRRLAAVEAVLAKVKA